MLQDYPKEALLKDGFSCTLRPMISDDLEGLYRFFVSLPEKDLRYLRDDPTDRRLVEKWCRQINYDKVLPILAEHEGRIIANATLHRQTSGWGKHVGEIRVTISTEVRQRGLVEELSNLARAVGLDKLCARAIASQTDAITVFEKNGYSLVATLKNFVKDVHQDEYQDIAILVKDLSQE
jgi:RimJ/RimL family protein N-acetyltransferase